MRNGPQSQLAHRLSTAPAPAIGSQNQPLQRGLDLGQLAGLGGLDGLHDVLRFEVGRAARPGAAGAPGPLAPPPPQPARGPRRPGCPPRRHAFRGRPRGRAGRAGAPGAARPPRAEGPRPAPRPFPCARRAPCAQILHFALLPPVAWPPPSVSQRKRRSRGSEGFACGCWRVRMVSSMPENLFGELRRYVGFGSADEQALRALHPLARTHFTCISEVFYQRILQHETARKVLTEGESMVGRLRHTLVAWMEKLLTGPWDHEYYELRARIGRKHVDIALPQHYMFGAMNVLRQELNLLIDGAFISDPDRLRTTRLALGKILDLELAIMLHTYREDLLSQQARSERLSTFGQLVGSIGHELRNPLGVMESSLYILRNRIGAGDERASKHVTRIGEHLVIANTIITDLLDMIRDKPLVAESVRLRDVVEAAALQLQLPLGLEPLAQLPEVRGG